MFVHAGPSKRMAAAWNGVSEQYAGGEEGQSTDRRATLLDGFILELVSPLRGILRAYTSLGRCGFPESRENMENIRELPENSLDSALLG